MPAAERQTGVESTQLRIDDDALHALIRGYCREAGVRNLQQHVERIYRKAAYQIVTKGIEQAALDAEKVTNEALAAKGIQVVPNPDATAKACISVTAENLHMFVGQPVFTSDRLYNQLLPGVCTGLAWTSMGGSTLYTECVVSDSAAQQGSLKASGHLKDVIRESCDVAYTVAKAYLAKIDAKSDFFRRSALHLHLPEGGTPKDGPSAGITITCTLLSLALNAPVRSDVAMTGEITLTGRVLPIGGVKEKAIGARRSGITTLIFPRNNKKDWDELPSHITEGMTAHFVEWYDEVFEVAFAPEIVAKARAAREVTRRQAIEQFEKERKGEAAPAEIEVEAESSSEKGKGKGKGKGKKKPAVKPTFVVAPRWATVGTPPDVLQRELADQSSTAAPTAVSAAKQL
jgi:Lon-like ATP-dependent protease